MKRNQIDYNEVVSSPTVEFEPKINPGTTDDNTSPQLLGIMKKRFYGGHFIEVTSAKGIPAPNDLNHNSSIDERVSNEKTSDEKILSLSEAMIITKKAGERLRILYREATEKEAEFYSTLIGSKGDKE